MPVLHLLVLACVSLQAAIAAAKRPASLDELRSVTKLDRRAELAMRLAHDRLDQARAAYLSGEVEQFRKAVEECSEAVEIGFDALVSLGRNPRRHPGPYKRLEIELRRLMNRARALQDQMSVFDREWLEPLIHRAEELHERLLRAIMEGKKL